MKNSFERSIPFSSSTRSGLPVISSKASQCRNRIVTCIDDAWDMREDGERKRKFRVTVEPEVYVYFVEDGYVAEGPGFYVWDEVWGEVMRAIGEFARGGGEITPTGRMLWIPPDPDPPPPC